MSISVPIKFNDEKLLNKTYNDFKEKVRIICEEQGVPSYFDTVNIIEDKKKLQLYIQSMGSFGAGQDDEKASIEILDAFEKIYNI